MGIGFTVMVVTAAPPFGMCGKLCLPRNLGNAAAGVERRRRVAATVSEIGDNILNEVCGQICVEVKVLVVYEMSRGCILKVPSRNGVKMWVSRNEL